ncbi:hypothetical protein N9L68_02030 [bacterium]|nr:hypothetical protein [bacterium]
MPVPFSPPRAGSVGADYRFHSIRSQSAKLTREPARSDRQRPPRPYKEEVTAAPFPPRSREWGAVCPCRSATRSSPIRW